MESNLKHRGVSLPTPYSLNFINILFSHYTTLWEIRKRNDDYITKPLWIQFLIIVSNDMLSLVKANLEPELVEEYMSYVTKNDWESEFGLRLSCKNIDKAVNFLRTHFSVLEIFAHEKTKPVLSQEFDVYKNNLNSEIVSLNNRIELLEELISEEKLHVKNSINLTIEDN